VTLFIWQKVLEMIRVCCLGVTGGVLAASGVAGIFGVEVRLVNWPFFEFASGSNAETLAGCFVSFLLHGWT